MEASKEKKKLRNDKHSENTAAFPKFSYSNIPVKRVKCGRGRN